MDQLAGLNFPTGDQGVDVKRTVKTESRWMCKAKNTSSSATLRLRYSYHLFILKHILYNLAAYYGSNLICEDGMPMLLKTQKEDPRRALIICVFRAIPLSFLLNTFRSMQERGYRIRLSFRAVIWQIVRSFLVCLGFIGSILCAIVIINYILDIAMCLSEAFLSDWWAEVVNCPRVLLKPIPVILWQASLTVSTYLKHAISSAFTSALAAFVSSPSVEGRHASLDSSASILSTFTLGFF